MGRVQGKVAFVTGLARGQGRSHALRLAEEGADIIGLDLCAPIETVSYALPTEDDLAETIQMVEALDRRIIARKADVRDRQAVESVVNDGVAEFGRLDIVVANAGIGNVCLEGTAAISDVMWQEMLDINLTGVWHTTSAATQHLIASGGGSMVLISSAAGLKAYANIGHYVAAKHGVVGLMRTLAVELGPHGIRVNSIHPTQVDTTMIMNETTMRLFVPDVEHPTREEFAVASQAMHLLPVPWVEPRDISNAVLFLASDEARYITGVPLPVDAGVLTV